MSDRKYKLIKEDIIPYEDWKKADIEYLPKRPYIKNTNIQYEAHPAKLKVINTLTNQVTTFNGKFCGKRVMFKLDTETELITIEGIIKPPKDPLKKLFWEKGFTGARRCSNKEEFVKINGIDGFGYKHHEETGELCSSSNFINDNILLLLNPENRTWYASDDLTLEEAKAVMNKYEDIKV